PGRIRYPHRIARVDVLARTTHGQPGADHPLHAEGAQRRAVPIDAATLPDASVSREQARVLIEEVGQVWAADLLLTLDQELDAARQLAHRVLPGSERRDPTAQVALVVVDAPPEQSAVALGRLEWRRDP